VCGQIRTATDKEYTVRPVPQRQKNRKPTAGVEPATPALRERCSGLLSYVGIGTIRIVSPKELSFRYSSLRGGSLARDRALMEPTPHIVRGAGRSTRLSIAGCCGLLRCVPTASSTGRAQGDAVGALDHAVVVMHDGHCPPAHPACRRRNRTPPLFRACARGSGTGRCSTRVCRRSGATLAARPRSGRAATRAWRRRRIAQSAAAPDGPGPRWRCRTFGRRRSA
jgi:hypothetical protein